MSSGKNKNVIFCGGARGLGNIIARQFREAGWNVVILDIVPAANNLSCLQCDVSDFVQTECCIKQILQSWGAIDALVNCIRSRGTVDKNKNLVGDWNRGMAIDLNTYFNASTIVCEQMKVVGTGSSIVNISSVLSESVTLSEPLSYHTAKAAINQLTRYLAVQFGPYNIRVNAILPGLISNEQREMASFESSASLYSKLANHIPLRRSGDPTEIGDLALFLASSASSFITGQQIVIDGGLSIREPLSVKLDKQLESAETLS